MRVLALAVLLMPGPHRDQFYPSGSWAPTTARVNPRVRYAAPSGPPIVVGATRMEPAEVRERAVRWGHWRADAADETAGQVPVWVREDAGGYGAFYPGDDVGLPPHIEVSRSPEGELDLRVEHELHHGADYAGPFPPGWTPEQSRADLAGLSGQTDFPQAARQARWVQENAPDDVVHYNHYLAHRTGYDYNAFPAEYRARYFPYGDLAYHAPPPYQQPAEDPVGRMRFRYVLPMVTR